MIFAESGPVEASSSNEGLPSAFALGAEYAPGASSVELVDGYMSAQTYLYPGRGIVERLSRIWESRLTLAAPGYEAWTFCGCKLVLGSAPYPRHGRLG